MLKMRMRSANLRGRYVQCNLCTRRFQNASALDSHRAIAHRIAARSIKKTTKPNISLAPKTAHGIKTVPILTKGVIKLKETADEKSEIEPIVKYESESATIAAEEKVLPPKTLAKCQMEAKETKVQFECPECHKLFSVYFSASRHISKCHSIKNVGDTVSPSSTERMKPIRIEMCSLCNTVVRSMEVHYCSNHFMLNNTQFECLGCDQVFNTISLYDFHVKNLHYEDVESLFFPNYDAFINWKNNVEEQTEIKFLKMSKRYHIYYYRCSQLVAPEDSETGRAYLCPATIVTQEFSKGIQVHFYKKHYKHECKHYVLPDSMKCHSITTLVKKVGNYKDITATQADDKDMYVQFKTLMESVVVNAAKLKMDVLNILMEKALEMTSVLTNYNEEESDSHNFEDLNATAPSKNLTDDQISKALEGLRSSQRKRKNTDAEASITPVRVTPKIINTFSLNQEVDILRNALTKDVAKSSSDDEKKPAVVGQPSSFNDSYKEFVDKQIIKPAVTRSNSKKEEIRNKTNTSTDFINVTTVLKDQNATNKQLSVMLTPVTTVVNTAVNITAEPLFVDIKPTIGPQSNNQQNISPLVGQKVVKVATNVKTAPQTDSNQKAATPKTASKPVDRNRTPPVSQKATPKEKAKVANEKPAPVVTYSNPNKKRAIIRTKLGQFSPKRQITVSPNLANIKVEKYEVRERDNDCNILILKI